MIKKQNIKKFTSPVIKEELFTLKEKKGGKFKKAKLDVTLIDARTLGNIMTQQKLTKKKRFSKPMELII
jgi:hypothetical protein